MNIVYTIGLLLAFIAGFFVAIKSVQLGLRWNIQTQQKQVPTMDNPVKEAVQTVQQTKHEQYNNEILNEWLNGAVEK